MLCRKTNVAWLIRNYQYISAANSTSKPPKVRGLSGVSLAVRHSSAEISGSSTRVDVCTRTPSVLRRGLH